MTKAIDYSNFDISIGAKYGKREIIGDRKKIKDTWHILCKCECGTIKYVKQYDLVKCLYPTCINCNTNLSNDERVEKIGNAINIFYDKYED